MLAPTPEEGDQAVPIAQGEEVYQEVLGATWVVQIEQIVVAKPENRWRLPGG